MRAGDSNGVVSKPEGVPGASGVGGLDGVVVVGALAAGALATGTATARAARTAPNAARRARADELGHEREDGPTEVRYAGAWLRRKSRQ